MNRSILALSLVAAALSLGGCVGSGCNANGAPVLTMRSPLLFDREVPSAAGPRAVMVPSTTYAFPSYAVPAAPAARDLGPSVPTYTPMPGASRGCP